MAGYDVSRYRSSEPQTRKQFTTAKKEQQLIIVLHVLTLSRYILEASESFNKKPSCR